MEVSLLLLLSMLLLRGRETLVLHPSVKVVWLLIPQLRTYAHRAIKPAHLLMSWLLLDVLLSLLSLLTLSRPEPSHPHPSHVVRHPSKNPIIRLILTKQIPQIHIKLRDGTSARHDKLPSRASASRTARQADPADHITVRMIRAPIRV